MWSFDRLKDFFSNDFSPRAEEDLLGICAAGDGGKRRGQKTVLGWRDGKKPAEVVFGLKQARAGREKLTCPLFPLLKTLVWWRGLTTAC